MFAVYATHAAPDDPLSALKSGERPDPDVPEGWVRVKVRFASLNRHEPVHAPRDERGTPRGSPTRSSWGNDAAGTLDDGTPVVVYPMMGSDDWRGTRRSIPGGTSPASSFTARSPTTRLCPGGTQFPARGPFAPSCFGPRTAWLNRLPRAVYQVGAPAGRDGAGQGATGGMATALIQLGRAAGFEVWATSRSEDGSVRAPSRSVPSGALCPTIHCPKGACRHRQCRAESWVHSLSSLAEAGRW